MNISPQSLPVKVDSTWFMLPLVGLLAAFPPIATSMYLPAMPHLQSVWNVELKTINLTLVCFYLSYCSSLLAYGFYFGMTSMAMMIGASICVRVSEKVKDMTMIQAYYGWGWVSPFPS